MTDLSQLGHSSAGRLAVPRVSWVTWLYAVVAVAGGVGLALALAQHPAVTPEWQLTLLLRFMAVVKASMVLAAVGLTRWRLRQPIEAGIAAGYIAGVGFMLFAPGLIWSLAHVALGAGLFHLGLLTYLVLAWRDDAAGRLLSRRST